MKNYQVWMEGYRVSGNSSTAKLLFNGPAESFSDACQKAVAPEKIDPNSPRIWGCILFDNEADARSNFG